MHKYLNMATDEVENVLKNYIDTEDFHEILQILYEEQEIYDASEEICVNVSMNKVLTTSMMLFIVLFSLLASSRGVPAKAQRLSLQLTVIYI